MTRKELFNFLKQYCENVYNIGENRSVDNIEYIVMKYINQMKPVGVISAGGWQYVHIFVYVTRYDYDRLDSLINELCTAFKNHDIIELTGLSEEFLESGSQQHSAITINAIGRRIEIRIPKEV